MNLEKKLSLYPAIDAELRSLRNELVRLVLKKETHANA